MLISFSYADIYNCVLHFKQKKEKVYNIYYYTDYAKIAV